jgi:hypothetical protein
MENEFLTIKTYFLSIERQSTVSWGKLYAFYSLSINIERKKIAPTNNILFFILERRANSAGSIKRVPSLPIEAL